MVSLRDDWKVLRPLLGSFIAKLDQVAEPSAAMEETLDKVREAAYKKGYKQGCTDCRDNDICQNCSKKQFYEQNINYRDVIKLWQSINYEERGIVIKIMEKLAQRWSKK